MTRPGDRLRRIAAHMFSVTMMERLIDPVVADLQIEYDDAVRRGRVWTSRWVRLAGYVALLRAIAAYGCARAAAPIHTWTADDHRAFDRVIGFTAALVVVATLLLMGGPFVDLKYRASVLLFLILQALPVSVPVALTFGILFGLRGCLVSRRLKAAVLTTALVCAVASFVSLGWIIPAANQAFRVAMARSADVPTGVAELTFGELRQQIGEAERAGSSGRVQLLSVRYQTSWALSLAALVLTPFALVVVTRRTRRLTLAVAGFGALLIWYELLVEASLYARAGGWPAFVVAWLPNGGIALLSVALLTLSRRRRADAATPPQAGNAVISS